MLAKRSKLVAETRFKKRVPILVYLRRRKNFSARPLFESSSRVLAAYPPQILSPRVIYAFPSVAPVLRDNSIKVTPAAA